MVELHLTVCNETTTWLGNKLFRLTSHWAANAGYDASNSSDDPDKCWEEESEEYFDNIYTSIHPCLRYGAFITFYFASLALVSNVDVFISLEQVAMPEWTSEQRGQLCA